MPMVGSEHIIPVSERPQTHALDRVATGTAFTITYVPETNHVSTVNNVTAILYLQILAHVMLFPMYNVSYFYISILEVLIIIIIPIIIK